MKCKCGNILFKIQIIPCCDGCSNNPAYDGGNYIYDKKIIETKGLNRDGVEVDGACRLGSAFGAGCYMFICNDCNKRQHFPAIDEC